MEIEKAVYIIPGLEGFQISDILNFEIFANIDWDVFSLWAESKHKINSYSYTPYTYCTKLSKYEGDFVQYF